MCSKCVECVTGFAFSYKVWHEWFTRDHGIYLIQPAIGYVIIFRFWRLLYLKFCFTNTLFIIDIWLKRGWHSIGRGLTTCVTRQVLFYLDKKLNNSIFKTNSYERGCHTLTGNANNNKAVNDNTVRFQSALRNSTRNQRANSCNLRVFLQQNLSRVSLKKVPLLHNPYHFDARYP